MAEKHKRPGELLNFTIYFHHKLKQLIAMADIHSSIFDNKSDVSKVFSICVHHSSGSDKLRNCGVASMEDVTR